MAQLLRYKWVILALLADGVIFIWHPVLGIQIAGRTTDSFLEMLSFIPPIFIILGLLDTWVPREKVVSHLGSGSGIKGITLATTLGAAAAGPLYGAFPVAAVMMKKGASFFNVMVFIGAWATLKIPMFLFETQFLGGMFSVTRWICSLAGIVLIAFILDRLHSDVEKQAIYAKHQQ
ncbi:permease [Pelosinus sp. IPA-1]|uniref:permease n=1 Tax=Pelosinus sp. IPA-1 TaxID=3029569 RepID=UPI0024362B11|nr:permease [Pelosinus sp. IPA-1]GMB00993.1 permease [Pelosinus sp. IPA-1]